MKKLFKTPLILSGLLCLMMSCSKKNDATPASAASNFTIGTTNYKSTTTVFTNNSLLSIDQSASTQVEMGIDFASRPAAGTYTVNTSGTGTDASHCTIEAGNTTGSSSLISVGGGTVTVTVSGGKLHATFSNIAMGIYNPQTGHPQQATTISGTLTEQ